MMRTTRPDATYAADPADPATWPWLRATYAISPDGSRRPCIQLNIGPGWSGAVRVWEADVAYGGASKAMQMAEETLERVAAWLG